MSKVVFMCKNWSLPSLHQRALHQMSERILHTKVLLKSNLILVVSWIYIVGRSSSRPWERERLFPCARQPDETNSSLLFCKLQISHFREERTSVGGSKLLLKLLWGLFTHRGGAVSSADGTKCRVWELIATCGYNWLFCQDTDVMWTADIDYLEFIFNIKKG